MNYKRSYDEFIAVGTVSSLVIAVAALWALSPVAGPVDLTRIVLIEGFAILVLSSLVILLFVRLARVEALMSFD